MDKILEQLDTNDTISAPDKSVLIQNAVYAVMESVPLGVRVFLQSVLSIATTLDTYGKYECSTALVKSVLLQVEDAVAMKSITSMYKTVVDYTFNFLRGDGCHQQLDKFERFYNVLLEKYSEECSVLLAGTHSCSFLFLHEHKDYRETLCDMAECFKAWHQREGEIHVRLLITKEVSGKELTIALDKLACAYYNSGNPLCVQFHERALSLTVQDLPERTTIVKEHLATSHKKHGSDKRAAILFHQVMESWKNSKDVFIQFRRGRALYRNGLLSQATKVLLQALQTCADGGYRSTPVEGKILYFLAKCSLQAGHRDVALHMAENARDNQDVRQPESYVAYVKSVNLVEKIKCIL